MTEENYYKPCSTCHNADCVWMGGKDTHKKCEDYQPLEPNYKSFCLFVAKTIMEEDFELNAGAYAEIFCRKLADLGIVRADGDSWVLEREE